MNNEDRPESRLLWTLFEQFPNGLVTLFDEDFRYQLAGGTGLIDSGIAPADLEGERLQDVFPEESVQAMKPLYRRALAGERNVTEVEFDSRIFRIHVLPVRDSDGDVFAGMTMSQDVTTERRRARELAEAKQRYETILQATPDPVFVADVETGEIVEVNDAAIDFRGEPREDIIGMDQSALHPPDPDDRYRDLFEQHVRDGGTLRWMPDGDPIYAVSADGDRTPVEISVGTLELEDGAYIFGMFRDITDQLRYERALTDLTTATRDLFTAGDPQGVAESVVHVVTDVLDIAGAGVYLFDEDDGVLDAVTYELPEGVPESYSVPHRFEPGDGIAWRVFSSGDPAVLDDVRAHDDVYNRETPMQSEILHPLGEWGVLLVSETAVGAFDSQTQELVELLATTATAALDRACQYRELQEREQELAARTEELERAEAINQLRDVVQILVGSSTRSETLEAVCEQLVDTDPFEFAWIGRLDTGHERLEPTAWSGAHVAYLESRDWMLRDAPDAEPAVRTGQTGTVHAVENTAQSLTRESWRNTALTRGFKSVLSVPLSYQGTRHGVLTVYADTVDAFPPATQSALTDLGALIANELSGFDRKQALLSNQATELDFGVSDRGCYFTRSAQSAKCSLELEGMIPQADDSLLVLVRITDGSVDQYVDYAEAATVVESVGRVASSDDALLQLRFTQPIFASIWAEQGIVIRQISADMDQCTMTVAVPPTYDVRQVVNVVSTMFPESELLAKREYVDAFDALDEPDQQLLESLTARQRETLELAYTSGYFETPRGARSEDLAEQLDISTSAFHQHLRTAEQKLVRALFGAGNSAT